MLLLVFCQPCCTLLILCWIQHHKKVGTIVQWKFQLKVGFFPFCITVKSMYRVRTTDCSRTAHTQGLHTPVYVYTGSVLQTTVLATTVCTWRSPGGFPPKKPIKKAGICRLDCKRARICNILPFTVRNLQTLRPILQTVTPMGISVRMSHTKKLPLLASRAPEFSGLAMKFSFSF